MVDSITGGQSRLSYFAQSPATLDDEKKKVDFSMSNSFGFGGHNAVLIFKSFSV